jgi:N-acetylmuramoyl-L-alanine amidase/Penicillin-insensitive murein endopeptidase
MNRQQLGALLNLEENLIPKGRTNRPGTANSLSFITIHNTDNTDAGADARAHGNFVKNTGYYIYNGSKNWVSWHYTVDDKRIVKHLPIEEKAFHAGSANTQSIAIEICMFRGIDQDAAFLRAARLCAVLLYDLSSLNGDIQKIKPHQFWTGKNCPRLLLNNGRVGSKWNQFLQMVQEQLDSIEVEESIAVRESMTLEADKSLAILPEVKEFADFHLDARDVMSTGGHSVAIASHILALIEDRSVRDGVSVETLINLWLQEKLAEVSDDNFGFHFGHCLTCDEEEETVDNETPIQFDDHDCKAFPRSDETDSPIILEAVPFPFVTVQIPTSGQGFYSYSANRDKQYGLAETIEAIESIASDWFSEHSIGPVIGIGNISLNGGGVMRPHKSHQKGLDVDFRLLRKDGARIGVDYQSPSYSRSRTQQLVDTIRANSVLDVDLILFNDPDVMGVEPWEGHDDHLHVRFIQP